MLGTFVIETILGLHVMLTRKGIIARLSVVLLFCLAAFQLCEYFVCVGSPTFRLDWTRFGLVCISFLPALGVDLAGLLTRRTWLVFVGYAAALAFSVTFFLLPSASAAGSCLGNYILIAMPNSRFSELYMWYYFGFIVLGMSQLIWGMIYDKQISRPLYWARLWFVIGYLSFTVPMAVVAFMSPSARAGTPSLMCGFALSLAVIVALRVVPLSVPALVGSQQPT